MMRILVLNGGSSSLKAGLFEVDGATEESEPAKPVWSKVSGIDSDDAAVRLLETLDAKSVDAVGHRIVNGGKLFTEAVRITAEVKSALASLAQTAPQHNRVEMAAIQTTEDAFPGAPQVAVFDSAFHATLPPAAYVYPGPAAWLDRGIRRFGFHGISFRYVSRRAARLLNRPLEELKLIACHLGGGCSLAAISSGRSIDTTMGFTPLDGIMMGTRSGAIDPGIPLYLMHAENCTVYDIDRVLNRESGLKGLAGSSDMREIEKAAAGGDERARLALDVFVHRLAAGIGSMLASLGGVDAIVFTGGIGENSSLVRERACAAFAFLGLRIDPARNAQPPDRDIATGDSRVRALVIRTQEDWEIARESERICKARL